MNFSQLGAAVQRLLRQVPGTNGLYTSADLSAVINDANLDVVKDTGALQASGQVYSVSGTYQYALSANASNYLQIYRVFWNKIPMQRIGFADWRWSQGDVKTSGTPRYYRIWNGQLEFDPTPDEAEPIDIYYTYKPTELSLSNSSPELPTEYHMAIIYRACAYLTIKDEKEMRFNAFFSKYQYELARLRSMQMGNDSEQIPLDTNTGTTLNNWNSIY